MSTSRFKCSRATTRSQPNPNHRGITFSSDEQREKFDKFLEKTFEPTRFITTLALTKLHVLDGVRTMNALSIGESRLPYDIRSALCHDRRSTDDTFGPIDHLTGYNPAIFWCQITQLREYVPKYSKSLSIIHPVLRVAHCILASIMIPRHETSTVSSAELRLLWSMTHTFDTKPNFGAYLARRLSTTSPTTKGNICGGGLVTHYRIGILHHSHFVINNSNRQLLDLVEPITDWSLSVITGPNPRADEPIHAPTQEHENPPPPHVDYAQYHHTYQERFSSLDRQLADICDDVDYIATGLAEHTSNFEDFWTEQRGRWETHQQQERQMHFLMTDIHRTLVLPRDHHHLRLLIGPRTIPPTTSPVIHTHRTVRAHLVHQIACTFMKILNAIYTTHTRGVRLKNNVCKTKNEEVSTLKQNHRYRLVFVNIQVNPFLVDCSM
ncbi:hypothetical protein LXL04_035370 [Taraxacum kok-saghyz]